MAHIARTGRPMLVATSPPPPGQPLEATSPADRASRLDHLRGRRIGRSRLLVVVGAPGALGMRTAAGNCSSRRLDTDGWHL